MFVCLSSLWLRRFTCCECLIAPYAFEADFKTQSWSYKSYQTNEIIYFYCGILPSNAKGEINTQLDWNCAVIIWVITSIKFITAYLVRNKIFNLNWVKIEYCPDCHDIWKNLYKEKAYQFLKKIKLKTKVFPTLQNWIQIPLFNVQINLNKMLNNSPCHQI